MLARAEGLDRLADVGREHLPILRTLHAVGLKWAEAFIKENESLIFRLGYHSVSGSFLFVCNYQYFMVFSC